MSDKLKLDILNSIKEFDKIIIHRHVRPDPDALGSQGGLAEIIKYSFPEKEVYIVGEEAGSLKFLNKMDKVKDGAYEDALVIVCDTANQPRICDQRYNSGKKLIKIDHHPNNDQYGDIIWVDTNASSASEMIYELYLFGKSKGLKINSSASRLIFAGIVGDTGRFLYPNTKSKTFMYVSELINNGFEPKELYDELYKVKPNVMKLQGYVLQNYLTTELGVASMFITKEIIDKYEVSYGEAANLVHVLRDIEGVHICVFFIEEENQIRVRIRSKSKTVNKVAAKYNGGGHPLASGASIDSRDQMGELIADLDELIK